MMNMFRSIAAAAALAAVVPAASSAVLTFDNLTSESFFTSTYNGFNFGNNNPQTNDWYWSDFVQPPYTAHSGRTTVATDFNLYNGLAFEDSSAITSTTAFKFDGAWFAGRDGSQVQYKLFSGSTLVYTSAVSAAFHDIPLFVASGYTGLVTGVVISGPQGYYVLDDFTYNTAAVPESSTYVLMLAGLAGIGFVARRRAS